MLKPDATSRALARMMVENTGVALCDSGGAYGRNWEKNKGMTVRDFLARPALTLAVDAWGADPDDWSINLTLDTFHFCNERLQYAPGLDASYRAFDRARPDDSYGETLAAWIEYICGTEGRDEENSYNGESLLSQVIQWDTFETADGETFIALQIHGGCDVRGGYTRPHIFAPLDDSLLYDHVSASLCYDTDVSADQITLDGSYSRAFGYIYTDDGCYFYDDETGQRVESADLTYDRDSETLRYKGHALYV